MRKILLLCALALAVGAVWWSWRFRSPAPAEPDPLAAAAARSVRLPQSRGGVTFPAASRAQSLPLALARDGSLALGADGVAVVRADLERTLAEAMSPDRRVVLFADADARWEALSDTLVALTAVPVRRFWFAVRGRDGAVEFLPYQFPDREDVETVDWTSDVWASEPTELSIRLSNAGSSGTPRPKITLGSMHMADWAQLHDYLRRLTLAPGGTTERVLIAASHDAPVAWIVRVLDDLDACGFATVYFQRHEGFGQPGRGELLCAPPPSPS